MESAGVTVALEGEIALLVAGEAERTGRSPSSVIEAAAAESLKMRLFPGIAFRDDEPWRRAWVMGTGWDVWEVVLAVRGYPTRQAMVAATDLTEEQISLALAYRDRFPEEVDRLVALGSRSLDELRAAYPSIAG